MKRKFCWLPTKVYSSKYYRAGFKWFSWAWLGDDGQYYTSKIEKIKARFDTGGTLLYLFVPAQLSHDPVLNQQIMCYKIKCNGLNYFGLGNAGLGALRGLSE